MKYIATLCMILVASVACAELVNKTDAGLTLATIQALSAEANTLSAELPGLSATINETITTDANIRKEAKVYTDDQKQKLALVTAAEAQVVATVLKPVQDPYDNEVAREAAQCDRTFNRETEMAQYNSCVQWKSNLDARRAQIAAWWNSYVADWNAKNVAPINAVIVKQNDRLKVLQAQLVENTNRYNEAMKRQQLVRNRIMQITGLISGFCHQDNLTAEGLSWCNSVDWDGASKKLKLMPEAGYGTGGVTTN